MKSKSLDMDDVVMVLSKPPADIASHIARLVAFEQGPAGDLAALWAATARFHGLRFPLSKVRKLLGLEN